MTGSGDGRTIVSTMIATPEPGKVVKKGSKNPKFPSALDPIPEYLTHYFERSAGPFLNICDLDEGNDALLRKAFTYEELHELYVEYGIQERISRCLNTPGSFVYSYVEAHIWTRNAAFTPC